MIDRYIFLSLVYQICTFEEVVAFDISFYIYIYIYIYIKLIKPWILVFFDYFFAHSCI